MQHEVAAYLVDDVAALMRDVSARAIMPRFRNLASGDVIEKTPGELVTIADREAEALLSEGLRRIDPNSAILGEEAVAADVSVLELLSAPRVWIIDPIDGTAHFAAGRAPFGIMIGLAVEGVVQASWIYDPLRDRMCHAVRGGGAFLDGQPLHTKPSGATRPTAGLSTHFMRADQRDKVLAGVADAFTLVPIPRCAAEQYPQLCLGEHDVALFQRTLAWDHAAGTLLLSEAGGKVTRWDGTPYRVDDGKTGILAAADAATWEYARTALFNDRTGLEPGDGLPLG